MQLAKIYDVTFENYEEVEGVQLYGRSTVKIHAQELTIVSDYNTTKINSEIDTTKFKNPSATTKPTDSSASSNLAKRLIGSIDQDNDGMISKKEAPEDMRLFFADIDTNQDGFIDASEAVAMLKYVDSNDIGTSKETPIKKAVTAKDLIDHLDKNGDTMIGKDEASEELAPHFDHIDTDGNGFIDVEEAEVMAKYVNESQGK
jgi:Ca2+-binding EF-hand superfamily protein